MLDIEFFAIAIMTTLLLLGLIMLGLWHVIPHTSIEPCWDRIPPRYGLFVVVGSGVLTRRESRHLHWLWKWWNRISR
jgi:hypothetical protein